MRCDVHEGEPRACKHLLSFPGIATGENRVLGDDYVIRKDSYTDEATGITHIYARQYRHGIEVADGDINLNIKDGVVLSFGDSVSIRLTRLLLSSPGARL